MFLNSESKNNLLYTGRQFDYETGLQFNRMRYYNPNLGIFNYKDPIKSMQFFQYAKSSPLNFLDPFGTRLMMTCFIGPIFPDCEGWQWLSYLSCVSFCTEIADYFATLCAEMLHKCIDNCSPVSNDCLDECHDSFFLCMVAVTAIWCQCEAGCESICGGGEYIDPWVDIY